LPELQDDTDTPETSGTPAYRVSLGMQGASQAAATLCTFPVTNESKRTVYYLPGGVNTVLTEAMMQYDIIAADNPAMTTLEVPENATLGLDYTDTAADHRFYVQNRGAGGLSVNFTGDANLDFNYHELTIETEGPYHAEQCFFSYEEDSWGTT
jgi:hypothetical protein